MTFMKEIEESFRNPLKELSADDISRVFSKALSDLTGNDLIIDIDSIDYNPTQSTDSFNTTKMKITISKPFKSSFSAE